MSHDPTCQLKFSRGLLSRPHGSNLNNKPPLKTKCVGLMNTTLIAGLINVSQLYEPGAECFLRKHHAETLDQVCFCHFHRFSDTIDCLQYMAFHRTS